MEAAKKPKKTAPKAPESAPFRHVYHVHATRRKGNDESTFSGTFNTQYQILGDSGFQELREALNAALDANPKGKATQGAFLTVQSLTYLGEL